MITCLSLYKLLINYYLYETIVKKIKKNILLELKIEYKDSIQNF